MIKAFFVKYKDETLVTLLVFLLFVVLISFYTNNTRIGNNTMGYPVQKDAQYTIPESNVLKINSMATAQNWGKLVLFTTNLTCADCRRIDEFITNNKITDKIKIDKVLEYEKDKNDPGLVAQADNICHVSLAHSGVPMLLDLDNKKCIYSVKNITNFLQEKLDSVN